MKRAVIASSVLLMLCVAAHARAATIQYQANALGGDRWQYAYLVGDVVFDVDQGFSVYFDSALYADLQPSPIASPDWDVIAIEPDAQLPSAGFYDALALVSGASLADPFVVSFLWLGDPAAIPGVQPFTINQFDGAGNLSVLERGQTVQQQPAPVPEPSTLMLTTIAAVGLLRRLRLKSSS